MKTERSPDGGVILTLTAEEGHALTEGDVVDGLFLYADPPSMINRLETLLQEVPDVAHRD